MNIAAYCRVSTDKDEQLHSLDAQKSFFTEYAAKNGHRLVKLYADEGITGTSLKKREEFKKLMRDAEAGIFEMVVVKDISRFARNTVDFLQSIRSLKAMGINTTFLTANMTSLGDSEFILTIFGAMAQEESANLSKRVKFGKLVNAKKGRVPQRIYGFDRVDNFTLKINPIEAETVRQIYDMYVNRGLGCRRIATELNGAGILTKYNCDWNTTGVRRVLSNPIYAGELVNNKYTVKDYLVGKQVKRPAAENIHHQRGEWAIIDRSVFDQAQIILSERQKQYDCGEPFRGARYSSKHIFSTLIKCSCCGHSFARRVYTGKTTRIYWKCSVNQQQTKKICPNTQKVSEPELLEAIRQYLNERIANRDVFIESVVREAVSRLDAGADVPTTDSLERKITALTRRKEKLQELYINEVLTIEELKSKVNEINRELEAIKASLTDIKIRDAQENDVEKAAEQYADEVKRFLDLSVITNLDMRKVIEKVIVEPSGKVTIYIEKL